QFCLAALPSGDNGPPAKYCSATQCQAGCKGDPDCVPSDGGSAPAGPICDVTNHACVECVQDAQCGLGQVCDPTQHTCVAGCSAEHACPGTQGCCASHCYDLTTDNSHCGGCGKVCASGTTCCNGSCTATSTVSNCGGCGRACDSGQ